MYNNIILFINKLNTLYRVFFKNRARNKKSQSGVTTLLPTLKSGRNYLIINGSKVVTPHTGIVVTTYLLPPTTNDKKKECYYQRCADYQTVRA